MSGADRILAAVKATRSLLSTLDDCRTSRAKPAHPRMQEFSDEHEIMKSKRVLSLAQCILMAEAARAEAERLACRVTISVVDDGGHVMLTQRMDGASPMSGRVAPEKATMAAHARRETKLLEEMVNGGRAGLLSSSCLQGMIEGGVPVFLDEECIGALGISGAKAEQDTEIARAGVAGFRE
jgi:glc operon protein GlcG